MVNIRVRRAETKGMRFTLEPMLNMRRILNLVLEPIIQAVEKPSGRSKKERRYEDHKRSKGAAIHQTGNSRPRGRVPEDYQKNIK